MNFINDVAEKFPFRINTIRVDDIHEFQSNLKLAKVANMPVMIILPYGLNTKPLQV
jgi:hypothetical protein